MSNPYDKYPGKGFQYIPGTNPPTGTMAEAEKRRLEDAKRQKAEDERRWRAEDRRQREEARNRNAREEQKRQVETRKRNKKAQQQSKAKSSNKSKSSFSEAAATIAFLISGGYFYEGLEMGGMESAIGAFVVAIIIGYTIKIILTLGAIFLVATFVLGEGEANTSSSSAVTEQVEQTRTSAIPSGKYYVGFKAANSQGFWYKGQKYNHGIKVSALIDDFPAQAAGVQVGDVIYRVDDLELNDMKAFVNYVNLKKNKSVNLFIIRNNRSMEILVRPKYVA